MEIEHLTGLIAAPPTAMRADGSIDLDAIERQAQALFSGGVRGAFVCGTTGESMSLTTAERMRVAERWCAVAPEGFAVIVHAGHTSVADSRELAAHAQKVGARAVAAMPPFFFRPGDVAALVAVGADVAAAAPALPFYYYHIPSMTGVCLKMADYLPVAAKAIPTLAGMKFTYEDLMDYHRCLELEGGRFDMLFGRDEILLSALVLGARGAVGTTYNLAAPLYLRVMDAFARGDLKAARAAQHQAAEFVAVLVRFGVIEATKAAMKLTGVDCGPVRPPLRPVEGERLEKLRTALDAVGFLDFCLRPQ
jgi:N-acetylneuraminate lyase